MLVPTKSPAGVSAGWYYRTVTDEPVSACVWILKAEVTFKTSQVSDHLRNTKVDY